MASTSPSTDTPPPQLSARPSAQPTPSPTAPTTEDQDLLSPPKLPPRPSSQQPSTTITTQTDRSTSLLNQPWSTTWRKALVSLPRAVPDSLVLKFTSPSTPPPITIKIPSSRDKGVMIPLHVFVPTTTASHNDNNPSATTHHHLQPRRRPTLPILLDFHGGGFVLGSYQEQIPFCSKMADSLSCVVITVDYRLGPYASFPAALYDAEDALNAVLRPLAGGYHELRNGVNSQMEKMGRGRVELDGRRVALSGFSSGGSLAYNLTLNVDLVAGDGLVGFDDDNDKKKGWKCPFEGQMRHEKIPTLLFYPALDTRLLPHERPLPEGMEEAPKGFWASLNLEAELMPTYLPKRLTTHPRASPGLVDIVSSPGVDGDGISSGLEKESDESRQSNGQSTTADLVVGTGTLHPQATYLLVLPELDTLSASNEAWLSKMKAQGQGDRVSVERVKGMLHGWTQFPDGWLEEDARKKKDIVFDRAVEFVRHAWRDIKE